MRENDDDDNDNNAAVKSSVSDILKKALAINSKPTEESFPELPDVLIWARFVIGLFCTSLVLPLVFGFRIECICE
jgi:hypothetical protein